MESIPTLIDLLTRAEFLTGLAIGVVLLAAFLLVRAEKGLPGWALAVAAGSLLGVNLAVGQRLGLAAGVATCAVGGWLMNDGVGRTWNRRTTLSALLVVVGAAVVSSRGDIADARWINLTLPFVAVGLGFALEFWATTQHRHLLGVLFAITAFGIWTTVPDTDGARVLLGVAIPLSLATVKGIAGRIVAAGAFSLGAMVVWVAGSGGADRPGSIIGAIGAIGILALLPLLPRAQTQMMGPWLILGTHSLLVLVAARFFGLMDTAAPAALGLTVFVAAVYFTLSEISRRTDRNQPG